MNIWGLYRTFQRVDGRSPLHWPRYNEDSAYDQGSDRLALCPRKSPAASTRNGNCAKATPPARYGAAVMTLKEIMLKTVSAFDIDYLSKVPVCDRKR